MTRGIEQGRWDRIASVFDSILEASDSDRAALLDQLCGSDETIRREVRDMLAAHERPGLLAEQRLVGDGIGAPYTAEDYFSARLPDGARVGAYRVVSLVGAGGMGDVYRAERADGAHTQTVALKVLRPGYRTAEMVRRFRVEREALARLAHPGIATILDGGTLDDGRPYIVLQFVEGAPLTVYCAEHALSIRERLALFLRIVSAVQFAHSRLVVHRDIKPSNIFVDHEGVPRLLDFGIAKLLDVRDDASLGATAPDVRLFTPDYAAPEQFRGESPTTATDVYALGVLLFELLTTRRPFSFDRDVSSMIERAVLETPAPTPSSVVGSRTEARALRGDLDTIVLTALRKERHRALSRRSPDQGMAGLGRISGRQVRAAKPAARHGGRRDRNACHRLCHYRDAADEENRARARPRRTGADERRGCVAHTHGVVRARESEHAPRRRYAAGNEPA